MCMNVTPREWVTCPCCEGEKWLEVEGNGWTRALFSDPRQAYVYQSLNHSYVICDRCKGHGEVLDQIEAQTLEQSLEVTHSIQWRLAA